MSKLFPAAVILLLTAILLYSQSLTPEEDSFEEYKAKFGKSYLREGEEEYRKIIFMSNAERIRKHNADPKKSFEMGINQFADLSEAEFQAIYLTLKLDQPRVDMKDVIDESQSKLKVYIDWVEAGMVTPIRNQGQCGSSWAFPATNALESAKLIKQHNTEIYSVQDLLDCSGSYGNQGCNGGLMDSAFEYIRDKGIATELDYPYKAVNQPCNKKVTRKQKLTTYVDVKGCDEMLNALSGRPIATAADASKWASYKSGILTDCGNNANHGIFLVGASDNYWKLKNTWGTEWGQNGYIRIARGNTCGICGYPSYPVL